MRLPRALAVGAAVIAVCLALAACGSLAPPPASPSRSGTDDPTPRASESAVPTATPAADELVVSSGGIGPIRMGSRVTGDAPLRWNATACVAAGGLREGDPGAGIWESTIPLRGTTAIPGTASFGILTEGGAKTGAVTLLQVWSSQFRTPSGLHVGSTDAEVRAALPTAARHENELTRWYTATAGTWRITLTVADEDGQALSATDGVVLITVYPSTTEDISWWNTDVGAYCSA